MGSTSASLPRTNSGYGNCSVWKGMWLHRPAAHRLDVPLGGEVRCADGADALATRVADTLLRGAGAPGGLAGA
ncbi:MULTISPECIES: hypothetical protein [unclassified Streptomyces]|uniref:hypothetical protein n=1 Tax=unclassified Streptomyces TaxID=2593676 RepID=UPI00380D4945